MSNKFIGIILMAFKIVGSVFALIATPYNMVRDSYVICDCMIYCSKNAISRT